MHQAEYYHLESSRLVCDLCPHGCKLREGQAGVCRVRRRQGNRLEVDNYAQVASLALDPIEKKPLYHFRPGSLILSAGANGCNLKCAFCQNAEISQGSVPTRHLPVEALVEAAGTRGSIGVAFTYSEPLMWYEYILEAAAELKRRDYAVVLVTNGYLSEAPFRRLLPLVDALNVDLKSPSRDFYRKLCKADLEPVQRNIRLAHEAGVHVEIAHLVVTGWNDNDESIQRTAAWIASVSDEIPLHLSRYFPHYRYAEPPTSEAFLFHALDLARRELKFAYLGNIAGGGSDTLCPDCGAIVIERRAYRTRVLNLRDGACARCGRSLPVR
ncbi:MAG: AmmeMemoRadiSam system radical SAM enzyme [Candidatus Zixiibacteriota bacterium]|nr:MAG: AmmeMemoRadiSam system radical SAM enzyme [candidate division Zixibacteria bacterium]